MNKSSLFHLRNFNFTLDLKNLGVFPLRKKKNIKNFLFKNFLRKNVQVSGRTF